jgi:hypothetical protein
VATQTSISAAIVVPTLRIGRKVCTCHSVLGSSVHNPRIYIDPAPAYWGTPRLVPQMIPEGLTIKKSAMPAIVPHR